ncbi:substrate-binding domain-containing protein [Nostoc sp. FACHB-110]|uniref:substrate-binding domain-containing protein n=1 Tax=Nostoc sp. FACHB-110 TaxID=2692834 RepID=UPI001684F3A1|nr:substrate-binding domain-containing protein [Nostoc sp. FACHB-110]MBD2440764.1 substrate-binding domain-containing protein [Nostoc sp. FACHB-110]
MVYEQIKAKLPQGWFQKEQQPSIVEPETVPITVNLQPPANLAVDSIYRKYRCWTGNPVSCEWTQKTLAQNPTAKKCQNCGFPTILVPKTEFRGYKGRYRIDSYVGSRGMGRLYHGTQLADQQPAIIKEYLIPELVFNAEEARDCKQAFERLAGLSLADGRIQDIRLNFPWDAVADPVAERCYLVTSGNVDAYPSLRTYLAIINRPMSQRDVYRVLDQVLQTLQFLHGQKFSLPTGQVQQGIAHGNINLDSLLIMADTPEFFIYVSDLAIWERLFDLPTSKSSNITYAQDLVALGYVAFYLLAGSTVDAVNYLPLDPKIESHWPAIEPAFKAFLFRLLELDKPFANAEEARQSLSQVFTLLPKEILIIQAAEEKTNNKLYRPSTIILSIFGGLILCTLIWWIIQKLRQPEVAVENTVVCCLENVPAVPPGTFNYTGEKDSTWSFIRRQSNLILQNQTLEAKLKESQPKLQLNYQPEDTLAQAIAKVKSRQSDFAIANMVEQFSPDLRHQEFAYDGLVVFVAFSYAKRDKSLPQALKGQISIEQLRDLYTGKVTNWKNLNGANLPKLKVKLYVPQDKELQRIFEQRVLQNESAIAEFRNLIQQQKSNQSITEPIVNITTLPTLEMLRQGLSDFEEDNIGSIGFATLSQVFGQCSAYPLAIVNGNKPAVQTLIQDNGKSINPNTDLCDDKGSYQPDIQVFKTGSYPLSYPLVVLYPGDNNRPPIGQKFADMLRTAEVQQLLEKAGLVPLNQQK